MRACLYLQGVESVRCASFSAALEAGHPVYTQSSSTLADGMCQICLSVSPRPLSLSHARPLSLSYTSQSLLG